MVTGELVSVPANLVQDQDQARPRGNDRQLESLETDQGAEENTSEASRRNGEMTMVPMWGRGIE